LPLAHTTQLERKRFVGQEDLAIIRPPRIAPAIDVVHQHSVSQLRAGRKIRSHHVCSKRLANRFGPVHIRTARLARRRLSERKIRL
jgi:hypothetical protein